MDQETPEDEINRLYEVGREDVLTDPKRRAAFTTSCIAASQAAVRQLGCEVRVTCRDAPEALFALTIIEEGCRRLKVLAKNQPTSSVIRAAGRKGATMKRTFPPENEK